MRPRHALAWTLLLSAPFARAQQERAPDRAGGFVLADAQRFSVRGAPLNVDNFEHIASGQIDFAALLEGETGGVSWRLRAEAARPSGRATASSAVVQELNRVFQVGENSTLSLGKRIYSMDQSYVNQPLGFFQKRTDLADPTDSLGNSEGLPMVLLSWVGKSASAAALYSKDVESGADGYNRGVEQSLLKFGYEFERVSTALIVRRASGESTGWGATVSGAAGEALSYYGSYYAARGTLRPLLPGLLTGFGAGRGVQALEFARADDGVLYPRATVGVVLAARDWPKLQIEYSYDRRGLSNQQYRAFSALVEGTPPDAPGKAQLAIASQMLLPQGVRQRYLDLNLTYALADWEWGGGVYAGVADWSRTWYASAKVALSPHASLMFSALSQDGPAQSEGALSPLAASVAARIQWRF
ncbi:hypothetical protein AAKU55_005453 [Oxalobacteraceae bacterium GrIS 1.11]